MTDESYLSPYQEGLATYQDGLATYQESLLVPEMVLEIPSEDSDSSRRPSTAASTGFDTTRDLGDVVLEVQSRLKAGIATTRAVQGG